MELFIDKSCFLFYALCDVRSPLTQGVETMSHPKAPVVFDIREDPDGWFEFSDTENQGIAEFLMGVSTHILALPLIAIGILFDWLLGWAPAIEGFSLAIGGLFVVAAGLAINQLVADARVKNTQALSAITNLVAANDAIVTIILLASREKAEQCLRRYEVLLWSVFCTATRRDFWVKFGESQSSPFYDPIRQWFADSLEIAGLGQQLLSGNGRFNAFLLGRSEVNTVVTVKIPRGRYVTVLVMTLMSITFLSLGMPDQIPAVLGVSIVGLFLYGIGLPIIIAWMRAVPFGGRSGSEIEMRARIQRIVDKNRHAAAFSWPETE